MVFPRRSGRASSPPCGDRESDREDTRTGSRTTPEFPRPTRALQRSVTESGTSLRVALCAPGELWGGVEQFVATLARHYHRTGIPVVVAALFDGPLRE